MKKRLPLPARIRSLKAYASARSLYKDARWIFLDANESPEVPHINLSGLPACNRYPDPTADRLRDEIAQTYGLTRETVLMASGSDEIIDLLLRTFVRSRSAVVSLEPSYGMYKVSAVANGIRYRTIELDRRFRLPRDIRVSLKNCDVLILCNPNNPTGSIIPLRRIAAICRDFSGIVVIDEAYGEFADAAGVPSAVRLLHLGTQNLVVVRTFSKAFQAAGIRLGYALSDPRIIAVLMKLKLPYNVNALTQTAGLNLWKKRDGMLRTTRSTIRERIKLQSAFRKLGIPVQKSAANFFLAEFGSPARALRVFTGLMKKNIIIRRLSSPRLQSMLRVTIGTREENEKLLSSLSSFPLSL